MILLTLVAAIGLDHYKPLSRPSPVEDCLAPKADWLHDHFNAGGVRHGWLAWAVGALLPAAIAGVSVGVLHVISPPLVWAIGLGALYFAMGYRQVELRARDIVGALTVLDLDRARRFLGDWRVDPASEADAETVARDGIRAVFRLGLERLFGVIFWFALLDLSGVLMHFLTRYLAARWAGDAAFGGPARQVANWLDWLPARTLAFSFAIAGNFDHALAAWRAQSGNPDNETVVVAAGAGALGVRLGDTRAAPDESGPSRAWEAPGAEYLEGATRLVWRALLLWLAVLAMIWLAGR